jgi:pimeloyl-ACP methyl ester carboxylesterase
MRHSLRNERSLASGSFIELSSGLCHYELHRTSKPLTSEPLILFFSGMSVPYETWDKTIPALLQEGYSCLRFEYYGRGLSDREVGWPGLDTYAHQAMELCERQGFVGKGRRIHGVALSMGGSVAARLHSLYPGFLSSLSLIDPLHRPLELSRAQRLCLWGFLPYIVMGSEAALLQSQAGDFHSAAAREEFLPVYARRARIKGFRASLFRTLRAQSAWDMRKDYEGLRDSCLACLLIWGEHDATLSLNDGKELARLLKPRAFRVIKEAGHVPHYEASESVNAEILGFLRELPPA